MEADVGGLQRKVVSSHIRPRKVTWGTEGIPIYNGHTLPFVVTRGWSAPAGTYPEQWFLVHPETKEVLYESEVELAKIWGLQSVTEITSEVSEPIPLPPGTYLVVFALEWVKGGETEVATVEVPEEEAA